MRKATYNIQLGVRHNHTLLDKLAFEQVGSHGTVLELAFQLAMARNGDQDCHPNRKVDRDVYRPDVVVAPRLDTDRRSGQHQEKGNKAGVEHAEIKNLASIAQVGQTSPKVRRDTYHRA